MRNPPAASRHSRGSRGGRCPLRRYPEDPAHPTPIRDSPHGGQGSILRRGGHAARGCSIGAAHPRAKLTPEELERGDDDIDLFEAVIVAQADADGRTIRRRAKPQLKLFSNIRAITPKLCTRSRLAIVENHSP